ncbi:shikimate dehydrogenase family protein [Micromonospora sp. NPDC050397]|uniref:shikimate dehydrogenase family protein n=1 Tax=Micromonospora sp. NPDC050397 TaxID=3364279 RepID=UPI00384FBBC3
MNDVPTITGATRLYAVLGDPVTQVQAPGLLNPLFARLGVAAVLLPVHVRPEQLGAVVRGLRGVDNLDGLLVTVPHKTAICRYADRVSRTVTIAGSANALRRESDGSWSADNFDGAGFVAGLTAAGHTVVDRRVTLVGAGGAGSAIAAALLSAGVGRLSVCDTDAGRLGGLLHRLGAYWPGRVVGSGEPDLDGVDIAVNATALGLRPGDALPFPPRALPPGAVVADIIMQPRETALLRTAAALGHRVHPGRHMLEHQIDAYHAFFRLPAAPAAANVGEGLAARA